MESAGFIPTKNCRILAHLDINWPKNVMNTLPVVIRRRKEIQCVCFEAQCKLSPKMQMKQVILYVIWGSLITPGTVYATGCCILNVNYVTSNW